MTTLDEVTKLFLKKEDLSKRNLDKPHLYNGNVVALDGYICIIAPEEYYNDTDASSPTTLDFSKAIPEYGKSPLFTISAKHIMSILEGLPKVPVYCYHKCEDCDGDGCQICDLGHEHDCEKCNGDGTIKGKRISDKIDDKSILVSISGIAFNPNSFTPICKVCQVMGVDDIEVFSADCKQNLLVFVKDVLLMVCTTVNYDGLATVKLD